MSNSDPYRLSAGFYDLVIEPMQAGVRRVALRLLPPQPGWRVLDVGCGTGVGLVPYAEAGCAVAGVDISAAMLEQAAKRLGDRAELQLTDGSGLPFDDNEFDLVTTSMVLHEVPSDARESFIDEMARVTKPEGKVLIVDFGVRGLRGWRGRTFRAISWLIERISGHYAGYRSFRAEGGATALIERSLLTLETEKPVAGGNLALYVATPTRPSHHPD